VPCIRTGYKAIKLYFIFNSFFVLQPEISAFKFNPNKFLIISYLATDYWALYGMQVVHSIRTACMNVHCCRWMSCFECEIHLSEILLLLVYALLPVSCRVSSAAIMNGSIFHFHLSSHKKTRKILLLIISRPPLKLKGTVADWLDWPLHWPAVSLSHSLRHSLRLSFFFREAILSLCFHFFFSLSLQ
jgi:hypothetical protein